jgi:hypothetical protein
MVERVPGVSIHYFNRNPTADSKDAMNLVPYRIKFVNMLKDVESEDFLGFAIGPRPRSLLEVHGEVSSVLRREIHIEIPGTRIESAPKIQLHGLDHRSHRAPKRIIAKTLTPSMYLGNSNQNPYSTASRPGPRPGMVPALIALTR